MSSFLSSPRRRRRAMWVAALVLVVAAIVGLALATRHSGGGGHEQAGPSAPALNPAAQKTVRLSAADRRQIHRLVARFVATGVVHRTAASYGLVTAAFRGGTTRAQWARGDTPVYPYPADPRSGTESTVVSSYANDVLLTVLLQPRHGSKTGPILFDIEVKRRSPRAPWLVESFAPLEVYSAPSAPKPTATPKPGAPRQATKTPTVAKPDSGFDHGALSTKWMLLPLALFLLILLIPLGLGAKSWRAHRRAERLYGGRKELPPLPRARSETAQRTTRDL